MDHDNAFSVVTAPLYDQTTSRTGHDKTRQFSRSSRARVANVLDGMKNADEAEQADQSNAK